LSCYISGTGIRNLPETASVSGGQFRIEEQPGIAPEPEAGAVFWDLASGISRKFIGSGRFPPYVFDLGNFLNLQLKNPYWEIPKPIIYLELVIIVDFHDLTAK